MTVQGVRAARVKLLKVWRSAGINGSCQVSVRRKNRCVGCLNREEQASPPYNISISRTNLEGSEGLLAAPFALLREGVTWGTGRLPDDEVGLDRVFALRLGG